jgi:SAM-dependent methyltransferase
MRNRISSTLEWAFALHKVEAGPDRPPAETGVGSSNVVGDAHTASGGLGRGDHEKCHRHRREAAPSRKDPSSSSIQTRRLLRNLALIGLAWGPATLGIVLLRLSAAPPALDLALAFGGALAAIALVFRSATVRRPKPLRADTRLAGIGTAWEQIADPAGNFANRWAMYQDLCAWLTERDWRGKKVVEFGQTNEVLRSFLAGAAYTLLGYPEHDVQNLERVAADTFDLALLDQTLEHVADPERALTEVARILKPDGMALITTPFLVPLHGTEFYGDYTRWSPQGLATLLERHGFVPEVSWWGNLAAARELLGRMHLKADEAMANRLLIHLAEREERFPVTVWALATVKK